jgi:anti-sigma factor RsiW
MNDPCEKVRPQLQALADGELTPGAVASAEAHLSQCPACRREAEDLARLSALLAEHPAPGAVLPAGAVVAAQIVQRSRVRRGLRWAPVGILATAVLAAAFRPAAPPVLAPVSPAEPAFLLVLDDERTGRAVLLMPPESRP